jgi:TRAP-type mannitol/chloroaromatic compound transport system permease small subunit
LSIKRGQVDQTRSPHSDLPRRDGLLQVGLLRSIARGIDRLNEWVGVSVAWLALFTVLVEFTVVLMRYVFGVGSVKMQESIVYMHATVFMVAAGYTLLHDGHVRCDIFYATVAPRRQALIDLIGVIVFLLPTCVLTAWVAWPYVTAAWAVREGSPEGRLGIPGVYLLKSIILVFAGLVALQGVAMALHAALRLAGAESASAPAADAGGHGP